MHGDRSIISSDGRRPEPSWPDRPTVSWAPATWPPRRERPPVPPTHVHVRGRALAAEPTPALPRACCADAYDDRLNYSPMDRMIRIHRVPWELDAQRAGCPCQPACDGVAPSRWDDTSRRPIRHVQLRLRRACRVSRCRSGRMLHLAGRCDDVARTGDVYRSLGDVATSVRIAPSRGMILAS